MIKKQKPLHMYSTNGADRKSTLQPFLLSIMTTGVIGCFGFLWSLNNTITRLQDHDAEVNKLIDEISVKINNIQLDIREVRERLVRIESKNQKESNQ
jgi:hypothetical protein